MKVKKLGQNDRFRITRGQFSHSMAKTRRIAPNTENVMNLISH